MGQNESLKALNAWLTSVPDLYLVSLFKDSNSFSERKMFVYKSSFLHGAHKMSLHKAFFPLYRHLNTWSVI